jgi:lipopolysaccharide export LptBFGC system permease protein LptF
MRILQRYLSFDLLWNLIATFVVLVAITGMLLFSIIALKTSTASLSVEALFKIVGLALANRIDILVPLATLVATTWTYGRARQEGEITAMRGAGIGLLPIILPAAAVGAGMSALLAWSQDEIVPQSHYLQNVIGKRHLAENIAALLLDESKDIRDKRFKVRWSKTSRDADGYVVLEDLVVSEQGKSGEPPRITRAAFAKPKINSATGEMTLTCKNLVRGNVAGDEMEIRLDLHALSEEPPPSKKVEDLSYEELLTRAERGAGEKSGRRAAAEFHRRAAGSFSPFLFALMGAPLGLILRLSNRAVVFAGAFVIVLLLHYGPVIVGVELAERGTLPATVGVWFGDLLILGAAIYALRRAARG